jgi:hypothetical protein
MLSHEFKCIFVHVPKTAGQSIEHIFLDKLGLNWGQRSHLLLRPNDDPEKGPPRMAHMIVEEYLRCGYVTQPQFDTYFKFGFVRNPWDRVVSSYKFRGFSKQMDFKTFVFDHMPQPGWTTLFRHFSPQYNYFYNEKGECLVDFIGRFENLQNDFDIACEELGIPNKKLPHVNKAKDAVTEQDLRHTFRHYTEYYDDETKQKVDSIYNKDIFEFGYEFGK